MNRFKFLIVMALLIILTGCSSTKQEEVSTTTAQPVKKVKVTKLQNQAYPKSISYQGYVTSEQVKKYSFKSDGKVGRINVEVGDQVHKKDPIAALNTEDLIFQRDAALKQMEAAKAQYEKAVNGAQAEDIKNAELDVSLAHKSYDFALENYENISSLYDAGGVSKTDLDQASINKDQAKLRLEQAKQVLSKVQSGARSEEIQGAKANYEAAKVQYDARTSLLEDATLYADMDGYIVDVMNEEGEIIAAGYPIVVARNDVQIVEIGVTQKDVKTLQVGSKAAIQIDEIKTTGKVIKINQTPDTSTKTYTVQLQIEDQLSNHEFYMGSTAKVSFLLEDVNGIWINLLSIMNDGEDYVYVIKDGRVTKKTVEIQQLYEDKVLVSGLEPGDEMVVDGMKSLKEGNMVEIVE